MNRELQNLYVLQDEVFPKVFELDKEGRVNLDIIESGCGTYRCLLGWYGYFTGLNVKSNSLMPECKHFGLTSTQWLALFGAKIEAGTLTDRYNYLCSLIQEKEKELGIKSGAEICHDIISNHDLVEQEIAENKETINQYFARV